MDIKKYEKLINLVINEDADAARELFHDIVVEKSREIFESIMAEEMEEDLDEGMGGGQVDDMLDEINAEEMNEEEDEADIDFDDEAEDAGEDFTSDLEHEHDEEGEHEEIEDAVIRIEDKLDQLMAEFEEIMGGGEEEDFGGEEDFGDEGGEDFGGEEDFGAGEDFGDEGDEEAMMEAIQLQKVSVTHGDNGVQTKSPGLQNSGQAGMDSNPVKFSGSSEANPTSAKKPSNAYSKGEGNLPGAGNFKNVPGKKNQDLSAAPKPKHGDDGSNNKSPVAESRRSARRPIR